MHNFKRIFLIVLDSFGIGAAPDAALFGDEGASTIERVMNSEYCDISTLKKMGFLYIDGVNPLFYEGIIPSHTKVARLREKSAGKDTITGHWEMMNVISKKPMPIFPEGFPQELLNEISKATGYKIICNEKISGTDVLTKYGQRSLNENAVIVYTSGDSVFQVAGHKDVINLDELYEFCQKARDILTGDYAVGRVIARPFDGVEGSFFRIAGRHDYSLKPPTETTLDILAKNNYDVISIGKINDIFSGCGITESYPTSNNQEGMSNLDKMVEKDFEGLCFANLVDFDMLYGHRRDVDGYAKALSEFDAWLEVFLSKVNNDDLVIITGDHGCDPGFEGTDHTREDVPMIMFLKAYEGFEEIGTISGFDYIGTLIKENFRI